MRARFDLNQEDRPIGQSRLADRPTAGAETDIRVVEPIIMQVGAVVKSPTESRNAISSSYPLRYRLYP